MFPICSSEYHPNELAGKIVSANFTGHRNIMENLDNNNRKSIMTIQEVAQFLHKSESWVYKHWRELGGKKLGGSLFFKGKEDLYDCLFCKQEGMEIRLHSQGDQTHGNLVRNKTEGKKSGSRKEGKTKQSATVATDANRHNLLGVG